MVRVFSQHGNKLFRKIRVGSLDINAGNALRKQWSSSSSPATGSPCSPPPCPEKPPCPPRLCPENPDPANPCNYCPPPCIDPDYPDMTRIKKWQCKFQEENGLPVFLKKGASDTILYQTILISLIFSLIYTFYGVYKMM